MKSDKSKKYNDNLEDWKVILPTGTQRLKIEGKWDTSDGTGGQNISAILDVAKDWSSL